MLCNYARVIVSTKGIATQFKRTFAQANRKSESVEKEWWKENNKLKENRGKNQLNLVFLEGTSGAGKGDLLARLNRLGYATIRTPFLEFYKSLDDKNHTNVTSQWIDHHQKAINDFLDNRKDSSVKDNVVFVQRSILSPLLHGFSSDKDKLYNLMNKIKQELNGSLVVLECDPIQTHQRLLYRYEVASEEDKKVRGELKEGEEEEQKKLYIKYNEFVRDPIVDGVINSTSIKQAVPSLFQALGIQLNFKSLREVNSNSIQ